MSCMCLFFLSPLAFKISVHTSADTAEESRNTFFEINTHGQKKSTNILTGCCDFELQFFLCLHSASSYSEETFVRYLRKPLVPLSFPPFLQSLQISELSVSVAMGDSLISVFSLFLLLFVQTDSPV